MGESSTPNMQAEARHFTPSENKRLHNDVHTIVGAEDASEAVIQSQHRVFAAPEGSKERERAVDDAKKTGHDYVTHRSEREANVKAATDDMNAILTKHGIDCHANTLPYAEADTGHKSHSAPQGSGASVFRG